MSTNKIWKNLEMVKTFLIKDRKCRNNEVKRTTQNITVNFVTLIKFSVLPKIHT